MTKDLADIFTAEYMNKRPSYARCKARARKYGQALSRDQYAVLRKEIRKLAELFTAANVDPAQVHVKKYVVNSWGADNFQVKAWVEPKGQAPAPAPDTKPRKFRAKSHSEARPDILFIPDAHFGYSDDEPIHDEQALETVLQVAHALQPAQIIILGDFLDLAGLSSFSTGPGLRHRFNHALAAAYQYLVDLRAACPDATISYIEGNHEHRINRVLADKCPELYGLRRAGSGPEVLGVPHLLRLDELGVGYLGPYKTHFWTEDGIRVLHGELLGKNGGETAAKMLNAYGPEVGIVCGHNHRLELAYKTSHGAGGPCLTWAMACGTLARLDGTTPGSQYPDWQQGFGLVWNGQPSIHAIEEGSCQVFQTRFRVFEPALPN